MMLQMAVRCAALNHHVWQPQPCPSSPLCLLTTDPRHSWTAQVQVSFWKLRPHLTYIWLETPMTWTAIDSSACLPPLNGLLWATVSSLCFIAHHRAYIEAKHPLWTLPVVNPISYNGESYSGVTLLFCSSKGVVWTWKDTWWLANKETGGWYVAPKCASANTPSSQYFDFPDATTLCSGSYSSDLGSSLMEEERMLTYLANKKPQKAISKEKGKKWAAEPAEDENNPTNHYKRSKWGRN